MKGLFFVIRGLLGTCMLVVGATGLAQAQSVAAPDQHDSSGSAMSLVGEKPASGHSEQGEKGQ
jgi:hypothetical protein